MSQTLQLRLGDCIEVMQGIPDGTIGAIITDPPYGLEFMGKDWDAPWKSGAGMSAPGIGERAIPWPSFGGSMPFGGANPTCGECGGRLRGERKCACLEPVWMVDGEVVDGGARGQSEAIKQKKLFQSWCVTWLTECFRVLRPGGIIKVFGATRMFHRMAAAMEEVGFILEPVHSLEGWGYGCLTEDTEVLTHQYGWVSYTRVTVGTVILGFDLQTGDLTWQPVEETFEYPYDREAFRLTGPDTDHVVSVGHRSVVQREGKWAFVLSDDLEGEEVVPIMQRVPGSDTSERGDELACFTTTAQVERVHYTGIVWCVKVPTGAFVARRNGKAFVTGNSGFPKSLNVGKTIDKMAGAEREVVGQSPNWRESKRNREQFGSMEVQGENAGQVTLPVTDVAKQFEGVGTALKPAWEPFIVGRKPA